MLNKNIYKFLFAFCGAFLLSACNDDFFENQNLGFSKSDGTQEIEFDISILNLDATRSMVSPKTEFQTGDIIHLCGKFELEDENPDGTTTRSSVYKYAVLEYNSPTWAVPKNEVKMYWPNNCVSASFKAFYIPGTTGRLTHPSAADDNADDTDDGIDDSGDSNNPSAGSNFTPAVSLSDLSGTSIVSDRDPLQSLEVSYGYGHKVKLEFIHACAYLIVEALPPGMNDSFLFTRKGDEASKFCNAYQLHLKDNDELELLFTRIEEDSNDFVYVEGSEETYIDEEDGQTKAKVGFFLPPGSYKSFVIGTPTGSYEKPMEDYITYKKPEKSANTQAGSTDQTAEDPNPDNTLKANGVYHFNVSKAQGVIADLNHKDETWSDPSDFHVIIDPDQFLFAIHSNWDYWERDLEHYPKGEYPDEDPDDPHKYDIKIVENTLQGPVLLVNVSMKNRSYTYFPPNPGLHNDYFEPDVTSGQIFDGGYHYVLDLASPLFGRNNGTIQNLALKDINALELVTNNYPQTGKSVDRQGILCNYNVAGATIKNVRIEGDFKVNASIMATVTTLTYNIGGIIGQNSGTIDGIYFNLNDGIEINLKNYTPDPAEPEVPEDNENPGADINPVYVIPNLNIGGLIALNEGSVINIKPDGQIGGKPLNIKITNLCYGEGAGYYIGGIVGSLSGGSIANITLSNIEINSVKGLGQVSRIGGMVGSMTNSSLMDCKADGKVIAGKSQGVPQTDPDGNVFYSDGSNFIGGIVGYALENSSFAVIGCKSVVNITGPNSSNSTFNESYVKYGIGGMFGGIEMTNKTIDGIYSGNISQGESFIADSQTNRGNFAGLVIYQTTMNLPEGITKEDEEEAIQNEFGSLNITWESDFDSESNIIKNFTTVPNMLNFEKNINVRYTQSSNP